MALTSVNPTQTRAWKELKHHFESVKNTHMSEWFSQNPNRGEQFSVRWKDFLMDFSKHRLDEKAFQLLIQLATECNLKLSIEKYFSGDTINQTEKRAVLHTALRDDQIQQIFVNRQNIMPEIAQVKEKIKLFSHEVISGKRKGFTNKPFTDIVNIGIGGSDLGPAMVVDALKFYKNHLNTHFISNVDGDHVYETIKNLNPETTLFVIVSKTFTTQETLTNATTIKKWFLEKAEEKDIAQHFVAVSTNLEKIDEFGISQQNVFPMWDWVGGRFSLWSAVGLSIALSVGYNHFEQLLQGAKQMDHHFKNEDFQNNMPVIGALLSIWYNNFFNAESWAIIPYTQYLQKLPAYLQQGIMESNGKYIDRNGEKVNYQTGNIIWGEPGTNSQHAFFQLIHQGTKLIPADFIGFKKSLYNNSDHHNKLMANFFAQTEALLKGKSKEQVKAENPDISKQLTPFKVFEGNKPTTTFLIEKLTPNTLGALIAYYEHRIFVEGVIWNIFSYDQWGVELGKQLANTTLKDIYSDTISVHDSSTTQLLNAFKQ